MKRPKPKKPRGEKLAFSPQQIEMLAAFLQEKDDLRHRREYALMRLAVDTMLRSVDLLALTHDMLMFDGRVVDDFEIQQQKTGERVKCILTEPARTAVEAYIARFSPAIQAEKDRRLFPFSGRWYHYLVVKWCRMIRLDPRRYGTHSFRRTKAKAIYGATGNIEACRQLLGHSSIAHTQKYLGVTKDEAAAFARKVVFK